MTEKKYLSKPRIILVCVVVAVLLGCTCFFTTGFSEGSEDCPPIKATIVFPEENVATAVLWTKDDGIIPEEIEDPNLWRSASATYYPQGMEPKANDGYDVIKPIEEYNNVVSVDNPTESQVIVREIYPVTIDGVTVMHEIIVWGNGSCISRPIT